MLCDCGHDTPHFSVRLTSVGARTCCRACKNPVVRSVANPFAALTLDHVHDDLGNPLSVSSLRQLQEAEKIHRFRSLVANERAADFDKPPQYRPKSLHEQMSAPWQDAEGNMHDSHWLYPDVAREMVNDHELMAAEGEVQ